MNTTNITASSRGNARVSLTGYATASAWAYFGFEHAQWFNSWRGRALFMPLHLGSRAFKRVSPMAGHFTDTLYWRHHWFSHWLAAQAPRVVIEIGAGLSARGITYAKNHPTCRWVDYDLPSMVAARRRCLQHKTLPLNYRLAPGDLLSDHFGDELAFSRDTGRACAMTEGVIDYLDAHEKARAFAAIARLLKRAGGGRYLTEVHTRDRLISTGRYANLLLTPLKQLVGRNLLDQLFADSEQACRALLDAGFSQARVLPDTERADAARAPADHVRAFTLIEARI